MSSRDPIEALVRSAGPSITPDEARMERAMRVVHGEWRAAVASRRRARWQRLAAACAAIGLLAALAAVIWPAASVPVATVARVEGDVPVRSARGGQIDSLHAGRVMMSGERIDTSVAGRVLLDLASGARLRIDRQSVVQWKSATELQLARGTVYVETGGSGSASAKRLVVSTPFGEVRHVGTRFEVQVAEGGARLRVRDGLVSFSRQGASSVEVGAGQQLAVTPATATVEPGPGAADAAWDWTRDIGPHFAIDGRSLFDALEWLGQETGLRIVYGSEVVSSQAHTLILRGNIDGLDTRDALRAVLAGSGLAFDLRPDRVEIRQLP